VELHLCVGDSDDIAQIKRDVAAILLLSQATAIAVQKLTAQEIIDMATIADVQAGIAALTKSVAANGDAEASATQLLTTLSTQLGALTTQLAAAIAANDPVATQAALDALTAQKNAIDTQATAMAAAVVANTPHAPTPA
jgi:hypothetical protein